PGKHLAVHASELVVKPDFQILRRYRRPLLLRLEHTHRPALEDYVHRATRLGSSRSLNLRIGITRCLRNRGQATVRKLTCIVKPSLVDGAPCQTTITICLFFTGSDIGSRPVGRKTRRSTFELRHDIAKRACLGSIGAARSTFPRMTATPTSRA